MFSGDKVVTDVITDGIFQHRSGSFPARGAESADIGAGVVLVLVPYVFRHVDKLDLRLAVERGEESDRKIDPGAGDAGADIEKAVRRGRIGDMQSHGNGILHVDEVSDLLPIPVVGSMTLEETHLAGSKDLFIGLGDQTAHLSLVSFVRAEDIEVFYAGHLIEPPAALGMKVEEVLRIAVGIQRTQGLEMIGCVIHAARVPSP